MHSVSYVIGRLVNVFCRFRPPGLEQAVLPTCNAAEQLGGQLKASLSPYFLLLQKVAHLLLHLRLLCSRDAAACRNGHRTNEPGPADNPVHIP